MKSERLAAVHALRLLDTPRESRFDAVTKLAARVFGVPIAFVSLMERERQWFKSTVGLEVCESSRDVSFCAHTIAQGAALVVPDTLLDPRFVGNPFVTGAPHIRFYAGTPVRSPEGAHVGTLCVADHEPHEFPPERMEILEGLGGMIERELAITDTLDAQNKLLVTQGELLSVRTRIEEELAAAGEYVLSLLPAPLREPVEIAWRFLPSQQLGGDCFGYFPLERERLAVFMLDVCGHGVSAALLSVALQSTLQSQSLRGADFGDPAGVLEALNREFPMRRHENRFFTIWYGVLDPQRWNSPMPAADIPRRCSCRRAGLRAGWPRKGSRSAVSQMPAIGITSAQVSPGDSLYLFSDGAFELRGAVTRLLSLDEMTAIFCAPRVARRDRDGVAEDQSPRRVRRRFDFA